MEPDPALKELENSQSITGMQACKVVPMMNDDSEPVVKELVSPQSISISPHTAISTLLTNTDPESALKDLSSNIEPTYTNKTRTSPHTTATPSLVMNVDAEPASKKLGSPQTSSIKPHTRVDPSLSGLKKFVGPQSFSIRQHTYKTFKPGKAVDAPYDDFLKTHLEGCRIGDLNDLVFWLATQQRQHNRSGCDGLLKRCNEERIGFSVSVTFICDVCFYESTKSSPEDENINLAAVLGTLASGGTYQTLAQMMGVMNIPYMSYRLFSKCELKIMCSANQLLSKSMQDAAKEELQLAVAKKQISADGTPWIRVYLDGCWSSRSYGHSYHAKSGVAVIIGKATGKVIHMGVKNKYCIICTRIKTGTIIPSPTKRHACYKNWSASSGAMEGAIILEGFNSSISKYGLKYLEFVADGDSSVYYKILKECAYGSEVSKVECKNHAVKNYGKALYKAAKDTSLELFARKHLTITKIKKLQSEAMRAFSENTHGDVQQLKLDIAKGPRHVFGNHQSCNTSDCTKSGRIEEPWLTLERTSLMVQVESLVDRLITKAHRLIDNETNNKAEVFMSIMCKFNAGKRVNLTNRGSFQLRASLTALSYNHGAAWLDLVWEHMVSKPSGAHFSLHTKRLQARVEQTRKCRARAKTELGSPKKRKTLIESDEKEYGPKALQACVTDGEYESKKRRLQKNFKEI